MTQPLLVIVHGLPASGKTTVSRQLADELHLPLIGSDEMKEALFDRLGPVDREWSWRLGEIVTDMLLVLAEGSIAAGRSLIIESAFARADVLARFERLQSQYGVCVTEVYCRAEPAVRRARLLGRVEAGERHPGHFDREYFDVPEAQAAARHAPLAVSHLIELDTTADLSAPAVRHLAAQIAALRTAGTPLPAGQV